MLASVFFFNDTATTEIYTLSLHDALPIYSTTGPERVAALAVGDAALAAQARGRAGGHRGRRDECGADGVDGARDAGRGEAGAGDGVWARLSAECGVWNAELQGKVVRGTTPTLTFRIPNSAFRTRFCSCPTSTSMSPSASAAAPTAISPSRCASTSRRESTWTPCSGNWRLYTPLTPGASPGVSVARGWTPSTSAVALRRSSPPTRSRPCLRLCLTSFVLRLRVMSLKSRWKPIPRM